MRELHSLAVGERPLAKEIARYVGNGLNLIYSASHRVNDLLTLSHFQHSLGYLLNPGIQPCHLYAFVHGFF